jgi:hypothetical protein
MAFEGHVAGEPLYPPSSPLYVPQAVEINAPNSVYFKAAGAGKIISIAHVDDPAPVPGGGAFYGAYGAQLNSTGDLIFIGQLTAGGAVDGLFRYSKGVTTAVGYPGEALPGGGHLVTVSGIFGSQQHINNAGDILFNATLDTSTGGVPDQGMYLWSKGRLSLVARTGTVLPGIGTIAELSAPRNIIVGPSPGDFPTGGAYLNDRGQVFYSATLTDGRDVLLLDTITPPTLGRWSFTNRGVNAANPGGATDTIEEVIPVGGAFSNASNTGTATITGTSGQTSNVYVSVPGLTILSGDLKVTVTIGSTAQSLVLHPGDAESDLLLGGFTLDGTAQAVTVSFAFENATFTYNSAKETAANISFR